MKITAAKIGEHPAVWPENSLLFSGHTFFKRRAPPFLLIFYNLSLIANPFHQRLLFDVSAQDPRENQLECR